MVLTAVFPYYSHCFPAGIVIMNIASLPSILAIALAVSGCAASLVYDSSRGWKQQECQKIPDQYERQRCLKSTAMSYAEYRKTVGQERAR
jgi:hypothetical protein